MLLEITNHQNERMTSIGDWYAESWAKRETFEDYNYLSQHHASVLAPGQDFFLGGFAGTGKSTILPGIIERCGLDPITDVAFCAPTGKAAKVMGRKLRDAGVNAKPTTIHKLIYTPRLPRADAIAREISSLEARIKSMIAEGAIKYMVAGEDDLLQDGRTIEEMQARIDRLTVDLERMMEGDNDTIQFNLKDRYDFPSEVRLIVVDEASMCGHDIVNDLAYFGLPILAIGDPGQLPPVKDKHGFNVLKPDAFLTEIHRQAKDNPIIYLATRAREGEDLKVGDYGDGVEVVARRDDKATLDFDREAMLLVGTHRKKWLVTHAIREGLGYVESGPMSGEPLMVCRNSTKIPSLVNGTIVECMTDHGDLQRGESRFSLRIKNIDEDSENQPEYNLTVTQPLFEEHVLRKRPVFTAPSLQAFDANRRCEHLDFAHASTVHKAQGSQWDDVVLHDESGVFRADASKWLYTGVTRAAKRLTVVV